MKKPIISIDDGSFNVNFDISEPFIDSNMVEKYTLLQSFIDIVYKPEEDEGPNEQGSDA